MSGFPLLQLNPNNLEKVINKLKDKSYFRIQQTCHAVHDFIHTSPNISVHVDRSLYMRWNEEKSCYIFEDHQFGLASGSLESFYGTCLSSIQFDYEEDVDRPCNALIKNRITCIKPQINEFDWSVKECAKVLNVVKSPDVDLSDSVADVYKAVFASKYLKKVEFYVDGDRELAKIAPEVLPKFEGVKFRVGNPEVSAFKLLRIFLKNICSGPLENLKFFKIEAEWQRNLTEAGLKKILEDEFNLEIAARTYDKAEDKRTFTIALPESFPPSASLIINVQRMYTIIAIFVTYSA